MTYPRLSIGLAIAALALAGCARQSASDASLIPATTEHSQAAAAHQLAGAPIQNVIVVVQQQRTFDNLFAGFRGADAPLYGFNHVGQRVPLRTIRLTNKPDCTLDPNYFHTVYDDGKMNGWDLLDPSHPDCPYTRVDRNEIATYWNLAKRYAIGDQMFASTRFDAFTDSLYIIAGTTKLQANTYDVGPPSKFPWGCDASPGTVTSLLKNGSFIFDGGPFPCFTQFPTIADLLDTAGVGWSVYAGRTSVPVPFDPFDAIKSVREGPDWKADLSSPASNVLGDLDDGKLRPVSFVLSSAADSDFPGNGGGPAWLARIAQHAQKSRYWQHLAIVVIWDDSGNGTFYDNVPPPFLDAMGLGLRVPLLVISPHVKPGYISHTSYEYASILKFLEQNFNLGSLGATDRRANSIGDMFAR